MSYSWLLTNFVAAFLLPPLSLLLVGGIGLLLLQRRRRLGKWLIGLAFAGLWVLSVPLVGNLLLDSLKPPPRALTGKEAEAIVVLGGGKIRDSLDYGGDTAGRYTLERARYGARLARQWRKPLLVTGGAPDGGRAEADILRAMLRDEYGLDTRWIEDTSRNTRENARNSAEMLHRAGIRRIYLVTHAWHLRRAVPEFEAAGFQVIPAGTGYTLATRLTPLDFLPHPRGLEASYVALHEWIGLLWYRIRD